MRRFALCFVAVAVLGRLAAAQPGLPKPVPPLRVNNCSVVAAEQVDLPPQEPGIIKEITVKEGEQVKPGQLLLQLDDRRARKEQEAAEAKYEAASLKANDTINVEYATAAAAVARAEYDVNKEANDDVAGAVSHVRMNELYLKCKETQLAIQKAKLDQNVAGKEAAAALAEAKAGEVMVERHKMFSPLDGVVVAIRAHQGESVQPMQQKGLIQIQRLSGVLWVEGDAPAGSSRAGYVGKNVDVIVRNQAANQVEVATLPGAIIFVGPQTEPGSVFKVRAKVENQKNAGGDWILNPGDQNLTLKVK